MALACPPTTEAGAILRPESLPSPAVCALSVSVAATVLAETAVTFATVVLATAAVVTVKTPTDWPCGITMLAGTLASGLLLDKFTNTPPAAAGDANVTVPVAFASPPTTDAGAMVMLEIVPVPGPGGVSVSPAATLLAETAETFAITVLATAVVVTVKVPTD
jgi:hypothetical protein